MPLRGYHRVGGPNATLTELGFGGHGTPSQSYPAYGTLLTSNNLRDAYITIAETSESVTAGIENYNTYANGLGGSYESSNYFQWAAWGTRFGSSEWDNQPEYSLYQYDGQDWYYENGKYTVKWALSDGAGGYFAEPVTQGNYLTGRVLGGLTSGYQDSTYSFYHDGVTDNVANGKYTYNALTWEVSQFTGYATGVIFMTNDNRYEGGDFYPDGQFYLDASDTTVEVPSGSGQYFPDGNDNRWEWNGSGQLVFRYSGLYSYGTFITNYQDYNYYWDGSGGYYQGEYTGSNNGDGGSGGNPPYGEFLYSESSSSDLTWYAPDGTSGNWTYSSGGCSYYADGMGGSYSQCGGWTASSGEFITSGSYTYDSGNTDEWGNPIYNNGSYAIYYDGGGGYYTNYS